MVKISLILTNMAGSKFYAKKGLKKPIIVHVSEATYNALVTKARANDWSLQTFVRRLLEAAAKE